MPPKAINVVLSRNTACKPEHTRANTFDKADPGLGYMPQQKKTQRKISNVPDFHRRIASSSYDSTSEVAALCCSGGNLDELMKTWRQESGCKCSTCSFIKDEVQQQQH